MKPLPLGPALLAEAIGTFALVFAGCGAIAVGTVGPAGVAAAFGLAIMTMIFALGHVSGAQSGAHVSCSHEPDEHLTLREWAPDSLAPMGT